MIKKIDMEVRKVLSNEKSLLDSVFKLREEVFVVEQKVSREDEFDEFETISNHFAAIINGEVVGTARWRRTNKGIKLERFAVSKNTRGKGVGERLVKTVLEDIKSNAPEVAKLYLHAQLNAVSLYKKCGFVAEGDQFEECGILHYLMTKINS